MTQAQTIDLYILNTREAEHLQVSGDVKAGEVAGMGIQVLRDAGKLDELPEEGSCLDLMLRDLTIVPGDLAVSELAGQQVYIITGYSESDRVFSAASVKGAP